MSRFLSSCCVFSLLVFMPMGAHAQDEIVDLSIEQMDSVELKPVSGDLTDLPPPADNDLNEIFDDTVSETIQEEPVSSLTPVPYSGQYFDASTALPTGPVVKQDRSPVQVDPRFNPGSRYVIVQKNAGASSFSARLTAGQRAIDLGRYSAALEIYEKLYQENPKNKGVLMGLAIAQQNSGFVQSAIATYEELLVIDPSNAEAEVNMLGLVMQQYPAIAFRKLINLWEDNSANPAVAAQLGLTSAKLGNLEDAVRFLSIAASLDPNDANHYFNMAVVTDRAGAYKDAMDFYQKALEVDSMYGSNNSVPRDTIYDRLATLRRL